MTTGMTGTCALSARRSRDVSSKVLAYPSSLVYLALTTSGHLCDGECHNNWNNKESLAPRCKVTKMEGDTSVRVVRK